jgi:hypothetical protein
MNKTERIRALDDRIVWEITFHLGLPEALRFSTYDEVILFLRKERKYWKNREKGIDYPEALYSQIVGSCVDALEATMKDVTSNNMNSNTVIGYYNSHAEIYSLPNATTASYNTLGKSGVRLTIPCVKVQEHKPASEAISFAYKSLYLRGCAERFNTFVKIALNENQNDTIQKYLGDVSVEEQQGAIDYLAYRIKSSAQPNKDLFVQDVIADYDAQIENIGNALIEKRAEIESFTEESAQSFDEQFKEQQNKLDTQSADIETWYQAAKEEFESTKIMYSESLKFKEPAKHWEDEARKQGTRFKRTLLLTILLSLGLIVAVAILLYTMLWRFDYAEISKYVPQSFFLVGLIAFLFYIVRTFIKITLSAKQLETIYNEKCAFTYFYLALLQDNTIKIEPDERILVFNTLFSKSDTGLVKSSDSKNDMEATILALLSRNS